LSCKIFNLPDISFIGGTYKEFIYEVEHADTLERINIENATCVLTIKSYTNRGSSPALVKNGAVYKEPDDEFAYRFRFIIDSVDTINLDGKYFYQIDIVDEDGDTTVAQGLMFIRRNINRN